MHMLKLTPALLLSSLLVACGGSSSSNPASSSSAATVSSVAASSEQASSSEQATSSEATASSEQAASSSEQTSSSESSHSSIASVAWNSFDGNNSPFATGVVALAAGGSTEFALGGNEAGLLADYFTVVGDGTLDLDTSANPGHSYYAELDGIVADDGTYPKYFTLIAGVTGPSVSSRVLDVEIAMADEGVVGSRLKAIIRADGGNTGVQLERATNGGAESADSVNSYGLDMLDVFRVYHFTIELTSATHGNVYVYADGSAETLPDLSLENVEMRPTSGEGDNYLRFGDTGSSAYAANIDWVIWTNEGAYTPAQLEGLLPEDIGCVNGYGVEPCSEESSSSSEQSSSSEETSSSDSSSSSAAAPDFDFEDDTVGEVPGGDFATVGGGVFVSDEQARTGGQSVKMTRVATEVNTQLRLDRERTETGSFKVSVFVPEGISQDVYLSLYDGGNSSSVLSIDVILKPNGTMRNRVGTNQENLTDPVTSNNATYNLGAWNDFEFTWEDILVSNEYTLTVNGESLGVLTNKDITKAPERIEIKYGNTNGAIDLDASIYVDSISGF